MRTAGPHISRGPSIALSGAPLPQLRHRQLPASQSPSTAHVQNAHHPLPHQPAQQQLTSLTLHKVTRRSKPPRSLAMAASHQQSGLDGAKVGETLGPHSNSNQLGIPENTCGSTTAYGHGDHPKDHADDSNVTMPGTMYSVPQEDLDGEQQMVTLDEGKVMQAQLDKRNAGWGEQESLTRDLERKKREQKAEREEIEEERRKGYDVDGGSSQRLANEDLSAA